MKWLIVSPVPTHPTVSGNTTRILRLAGAMERLGHEVWFLHADFEAGDGQAMGAHWGRRYVPHHYQRPWKKHRLLLGGLPIPDRWHGPFVRRRLAYQSLDHWHDPLLDQAAAALHARERFDGVIAEYVFCSKVLEVFPKGVRRLLDTHDVHSNRHALFLANGQEPEWFFTTPAEERKGLMRADCVLAIQDQDRALFERLLGGRREVVTVGHFAESVPLRAPERVERILYVGSNNTLNLRSIREFLEQAWPRIRARAPQLRLLVAGGICGRLAESEGVTLLGKLECLEDAYRQADVVINPIAFGTGLKIKSLEALAYGRALLSTPCGAQGLEAGVGTALLVAEAGEPFADALLALCREPARAAALAREAAGFVDRYRKTQEENLARAIGGAPAGPVAP